MVDYLRIARAAMADLKAATARAECAPRAESPKIEADQVELERAGARINDVVARKHRRRTRWRLRQSKPAPISSYPRLHERID
jgi:hypothetical protein